MSDDIYPSLRGLEFPVVRTPTFSTIIQTSQNGREVRLANRAAPIFKWELSYDFLSLIDAQNSYKTLLGFYEAHFGAFDSFLFSSQDDNATINSATGARVPVQIGVGDGTNKNFQIGRQFGASFVPLYDLNDAAYAHKVYKNAVLQAAYTITAGLVSFTSAPAAGNIITADFNYYWRVRFQDDSIDFANFMNNLFEAKKVVLYGVRS